MSRYLLTTALLLLTACQPQPVEAPPALVRIEIRPASLQPHIGWVEFDNAIGDKRLYVDPTPLLTNHDITSAKQVRDNHDRLAVALKLSDAVGDKMYEYTGQNLGEPIAIILDGQLLSAPNVMSALRHDVIITGGRDGLSQTQADAITGSIPGKQ